eukprot:11213535-Lingulodinium_polyedra.AAC.1
MVSGGERWARNEAVGVVAVRGTMLRFRTECQPAPMRPGANHPPRQCLTRARCSNPRAVSRCRVTVIIPRFRAFGGRAPSR